MSANAATPGADAGAGIAFISDVHANLEGLTAVLEHIDSEGYGEILCLGDVIGYGPDPVACTDIVRRRCSLTLLGNHDEALVKGAWGFNDVARRAIDWTRRQLRPGWLRPGTRSRWRFLESLPLRHEQGGWLLVHGSPRDPTSEYLLPYDAEWPGDNKLEEVFAAFESVCLVGHTHIPGLFTPGQKFVPEKDLEPTFAPPEGKSVINVGSVGQPRDGDPRACYLGFRRGEFRFHRVAYPHAVTRRKIESIAELDDRLAERLISGQ